MTTDYEIARAPHPEQPDVEAITLVSPNDLTVTFVPGAGMVGSSMKHRGEELLGMRAGLAAYRESGKTFGIPLLAPWANRLEARTFDGITLKTDGTPGVHPDGNGLPIHGLLAGCGDWHITRLEAVNEGEELGAWLVAELTFDASRPEFPAFPFPHVLEVSVHLRGLVVTIKTSVSPLTEQQVPIAFGWHPYFCPPGGDRQDWTVSKPFTHQVLIDERCVPTGEVERVPVEIDVLGDPDKGGHTFDDLFAQVPVGTTAWIEGGNQRITLSYDDSYPYAVLFAPPDQALVAIEPMTAPTDPLSGHFPIRTATQESPYAATYSIHVTQPGVAA